MATARLRTSKKTTTKTVTVKHNRVKVKSSSGSKSGKRGNPNHCPVCGKFM